MRLLFALLLALGLAGSALGQENEQRPEWVGVWEGRIGNYPVVMCLDHWRFGGRSGSYYYLSQMKPIHLRSGDTSDQWVEGGYDGVVGSKEMPALDFTDIGEDQITGIWRADARRLRIELARIPDGAEEYYNACASNNFIAPRVIAPEFTREDAEFEGLRFTKLTYVAPPRFEDVDIAGFTFAPVEPGDHKIVDWLAARLPQGKVEDDFLQCLAGGIGAHGVDGYYSMNLSPDFVNAEFLALSSGNSSYCGGAHPNHWQEYFTFDRQTGAQLDPFDWFNSDGIGETEYGSKIMMPPLREAILKHWPVYADEADDCSGFATDQLWWNYQLRREGVLFQPDFPHLITVCEEQLIVPWSELEPFLSDAGKALRDRAGR
uniref:hypothetical protein n=1 Tax=Parerythrobacter lutipelagi TaxID=1964208 RepID=UPI0010F75844|nr:hypothetical protein [Parerythrobacter lutipelagi]